MFKQSKRAKAKSYVLLIIHPIVFLTGITLSMGCDRSDTSPLAGIEARRPAVPLEKFMSLKAGMKKPEVDKLFGTRGEHQFTYLDKDGDIYLMMYYEVAPDPKSDCRYPFDLLYKNQSLFAVLDVEEEHEHLKALPPDAGILRPHDFDDDAGIREFFRIKSIRGDEISNTDTRRAIQDRIVEACKSAPGNPSQNDALAAIFGSLDEDKIRREYELNAAQVQRFDAEKAKIGMTETQINQLFGKPRYSASLDGSSRVALYGPNQFRMVNSEVVSSPIMVLLDDGKVIRVASHRFFEAGWSDEYNRSR